MSFILIIIILTFFVYFYKNIRIIYFEVIIMSNTFKENIESNKYFQSLPTYIKETIKQSGFEINSEEELRTTAEKLMKNN